MVSSQEIFNPSSCFKSRCCFLIFDLVFPNSFSISPHTFPEISMLDLYSLPLKSMLLHPLSLVSLATQSGGWKSPFIVRSFLVLQSCNYCLFQLIIPSAYLTSDTSHTCMACIKFLTFSDQLYIYFSDLFVQGIGY